MEEGRGRTGRGQKQEEVILGALVMEREKKKRFFSFRPAGNVQAEPERRAGQPLWPSGGEGHSGGARGTRLPAM
jgi:hypothetical protein